MLSLTAPKLRIVLSLIAAALVSCIGWNYSPTSLASSSAGKNARAVKRGPATIVLQDEYELAAIYDRARPSGEARPTTLATADLDLDGFPDIVRGYATGDNGYIVIQRGNPEAFAPTRPENVRAFNESRFLDSFLPEARLIELTDSPDLVAVGDFNRDNDVDVITARRGGTSLDLVLGNGKGEFSSAGKIALPGRVTTLACGQIDQNDTFNDLVVGIESDGAALLVFEDAKTGIFASPARYELPASAQAVVLADMDGTMWKDAAILAGGDVFILHGRNQNDGVESAKSAASRLERIDLPFAARAMTVGEFIWDRDGRNELALLRDDGSIAIASHGELDTRPFSIAEVRDRRRRQNLPVGDPERLAGPSKTWRPDASLRWQTVEELAVVEPAAVNSVGENSTATLFPAYLSGQAAADIVVTDRSARQLKIFAVEAPAKNGDEYVSHAGPRAEMALATGDAPIAAISMRTSLFVRPGLVFVKEGSTEPEIIAAAPSATFTVTKTADTNDGACNADCSLREAHVAANGAGGADIIDVPAGTYTKTIVGNDDGAAQGDLDVTNSATISGAGSATTIIQSGTTNANGIDKTFGFNPLCDPAVSGTLNNVTVRFGNNPHPDLSPNFEHTGGGLDYCGASASTIAITNSTFDQNTVNNSYGGGINLDSLSPSTSNQQITNCTITNNDTVNSGTAGGGGVNIFGDQSVVTITGTLISGNRARLTGTDGIGGGVRARIVSGGSVTINTSTISNNSASSSGGGIANVPLGGSQPFSMSNSIVTGNTSNGNGAGSRAEGGGFYNNSLNSGTVTVTESTFTGNTAVVAPAGGTHIGGGGLAFGGNNAAATLSFSRIFGNTATSGSGARKDNNAGTVTATNNWWGCSGGPGTTGCDTAVLQAAPGVLTTSPFLQLRTTASPSIVLVGQGSALTTSFLLNSAGGAVATTNLDALIGQTVNWSGVNGSISGAQTTIQATGTAAATFTGTLAGAGSATAQVDGGPPSGSLNTVAISVTNTATWDGSTSADWNTASNWTTDFVPTGTNDVSLPAAGVTNQANLSAANATVNNLTIGANRTLTISGARTMTVNGALTMNGLDINASAGTLEIGGAGSVTRTSGSVLGNLRKVVTSAPVAPEAPAFVFTYPVGTATGFSPVTANFTAGSGSLTVSAIDGTAPATPALNDLTTLDRYWQLTETGDLTAGLTFIYLAGDVDGTEANYRLIRSAAGSAPLRFPNGAPCPGAGSPCVDAAANTIFASPVTVFNNFWTAGEPVAPTAANVTVGGRVFAEGRGLRNAVVTITDSTGATRSTRTSSFGYYSFADVAVGREYVISVAGKGYAFQPLIVTVNDNVGDLDFIASP